MIKDYQALWAKKNEIHGQFYWLPLTVHLNDTMNVTGWLWNHWLTDGQRKYLLKQMSLHGDNCPEEAAENLVRFLGGIHDIGKATPAFQTQKSYISSPDLDQSILEQLERAGFDGIRSVELASARSTHHTIAGEVILHEYGIKDDIASIVGAHHGKPADDSPYFAQKSYPANYYQSEDVTSPVARKWQSVQKYFFQWALDESELTFKDLPEISLPGQVILSGLIIMADWIASNEKYFPLFSLSGYNLGDGTDENRRFVCGMEKWFRNLPLEFQETGRGEELFDRRFGFPPRNFQINIFNTVDGIEDPGIVVIEAPTGSGKTEAALAAAEQLLAITGRSGIFFGLPTQATSNGIFGRILDWTGSIARDYGNTSIRLVHGKAALNPLMAKLREAESVDSDEANADGAVLINEWFSGRKSAILDDFVVGTVDQFLLMALKQKHLALRHLGFDKKVVIIDEVHAYDAYMQQYLKEALRWSGAYHIPVILLSATLPSQIRKELVFEYMRGRGVKASQLEDQEKIIEKESKESSMTMTYSDGDTVFQKTDFQKPADKIFTIHHLSEENLLNKVAELVKDGGIVGIIVNTVKRSQQIASQCCDRFGKDCVELLHANFIATDRIEKEERLMRMIGKGADRPKRKIIIGTQVLEQSLDIDFDVLITDLCPIDLLIQRMGRVQRHDILRPNMMKKPAVYIMGISENWGFESGSSYIYGDYLLARTQMVLPESVAVPSDVPKLVQEVYGGKTEKFAPAPELYEVYFQIENTFKTIIERKKEKAKSFRLDDPRMRIRPQRNNLIGWLKVPGEADSEETAYAQVRDIKDTIEVIAVRKIGSGYSTFQNDDNLSDKIESMKTGQILARQTLRLPYSVTAFGKMDAVIRELEEYNRRDLPKWQDNSWLKGMLGIIFDENSRFVLNGTTLLYDPFLGLMIVGDNES